MSHTVTVTRTSTTTTSAIILNTGYFKTWPGILKFFELILGIVNVGLVGYYFYSYAPILFFLLIATTFMIGTFLIFLSCLITLSTATIISKTIYEVIYHAFACILYLAAGLTLIVETTKRGNRFYNHEPLLAASIIGLVCSVLYALSTYFANKSYRGV